MDKVVTYQIPSLSQQTSSQEIEVLFSTVVAEPGQIRNQTQTSRGRNYNITNEISFQEVSNQGNEGESESERLNNISNRQTSNIVNTQNSQTRAERYANREKKSKESNKENTFLNNKRK